MHEAEFEHLLRHPECLVLFQPVFSLYTGELHCYDITTSVPATSTFASDTDLWHFAEQHGKLFILEKAILGQALLKLDSFPRHVALIVRIHVETICNAEFSLPELQDMILKSQVSPHQIIFDVQGGPIQDYTQFANQVNEIRQTGFNFAVNGIWDRHPWLHAVALIRPDYIRANAVFTNNLGNEKAKVTALETLQQMARTLNCRVIAEGIDDERDLKVVLGLGMHFGAGPLLGEPERNFEANSAGVNQLSEKLRVRLRYSSDSILPLEKSVRPVKTVPERTLVEDVVQYFNGPYPETGTGVVIVRDDKPVGLVVRERLFQQLASKFGYSLYGNKQISRLMETDPLTVEIDTPLETVSRLAMARDFEHVYDEVIVTRFGELVGVVTVQDILNAVTTAQIELARDANPLTGLPGNRRIEQAIETRIRSERPFTIIYVDLDFFKWFNDRYGFQRGDTVIGFTANILKDAVERLGELGDFVGHIGGDDFILLTETNDIDVMCNGIIARFEREIPQYYPDYEEYAGTFEVTNRAGQKVNSPGISISLSVLECKEIQWAEDSFESISKEAGKLKKRAKDYVGSVCVRGTLT